MFDPITELMPSATFATSAFPFALFNKRSAVEDWLDLSEALFASTVAEVVASLLFVPDWQALKNNPIRREKKRIRVIVYGFNRLNYLKAMNCMFY